MTFLPANRSRSTLAAVVTSRALSVGKTAARATWIALGTALLVACAAPPVTPPSDAERLAMAEEVLAEAVYTHSLLTQCAAISPALKTYAQDLRFIWMDTHADALAGADAQFSRAVAPEVRDYAGHALALSAVRFKHQQEHRAANELRLEERSANNQRIVCQRRLDALEPTLTERAYWNSASERDTLILDSLVAQAEGKPSLADVPTLALDIPRDLSPGRSYREIEQRMATTCPDAELVVIANEWPHEAYGIYCGNQSQSFIVCDWGECRTP